MKNQIRAEKKIMGGSFLISGWANAEGQEWIHHSFQAALEYAKNLEEMLTDFHESSFNDINKFAGLRPVEVSDEILEVIQLSLEYSYRSKGAFDISYASVGQLWREARKRGSLPNVVELTKARVFVDYRKIEINKKNKTVYLPERQMKIGLGGIGKGFIIDKTFDFLRQKQIENFMVNGSGDVRVHSSKNAPRPWRFGIQNPFDPTKNKKMGWLSLRDGSLATSGDYVHYIEKNAQKHHHILNPKTGEPTIDLSSVTVIGATAVEADTQATIMMIQGKENALEYAMEQKLWAVIVDTQGNVLLSQKAYQILQESKNENLVA